LFIPECCVGWFGIHSQCDDVMTNFIGKDNDVDVDVDVDVM
jgi:hypothetical protein